MTDSSENRVLSRRKARLLNADEVEYVSGSLEMTHVCTGPNRVTFTGDADGCGNDMDQ